MSEKHQKLAYGEAFHRSVLKLMVEDYIFCSKAARLLNSNDFSDPLNWFFTQIVELYEERNTTPKWDDISTRIARQGKDEAFAYQVELANIQKAEVNEKTVKSEMTSFIRLNLFIDTAYSTTEKLKRGNREGAYEELTEAAFKLNTVSFDKARYVGFGDVETLLNDMKAQTEGAIPTGIRAIDEALGGGLLPGTWTTFIGASNAGKSMVMASLAYFAALKGKRTFLTVHEDEMLPIKIKFLSCFSKIPFNRLLFGFHLLTDIEKLQIKLADEHLKEFVKIQFMYSLDSTIENVCQEVRAVMKEWPFDLYLCDYGGCLSSRKFKDLSNVRIIQEYVYGELKQLCLDLNIPGAGGAQVNREAMNKNKSGADYLRMTDVAEAIGIIKKSSNVISINRSASDIDKNLITYLLDKSRSGVTNIAVECISDFSRCSTHLEPDPLRANQYKIDPNLGTTARGQDHSKDKPEEAIKDKPEEAGKEMNG